MHKRGVGLTLVVALLWVFTGCRPRGDPLAELVELHGGAERDFAAKPEQWGKANVGEAFRAGDALRTATASDAYVRLKRGGALKLGPKSLVRFRGASGGSRRLFGVESGEAEIEAGTDALSFDTQLGQARIEPGGRIKVSAAGDHTQFEVLIGQTVLEGDGAAMRLDKGEKLSFDIGGAILEHTGVPVAEPPDAAAPQDADPADAATLGLTITASVEGAGAQVLQKGKAWRPLPAGDTEMTPESRVRVPKGTSMSVARGGERASVHGAAEVLVGTPAGALLNAVDGDVAIDADAGLVRIDVPGGSIVARRGAGAKVVVRRSRPTEVTAERGEVEVRGKNEHVVLTSGQSTVVGRAGELEVEEATPSRIDLSITAGESAVVHDPNAPTVVKILFANLCPGEGEVEFSGSARKKGARSRGTGGVPFVAGLGANRYRVRCTEESGPGDVRAQGVISIAKDSGAAQLPRKAPNNTIDADGRRYTVLYQNILPQLTVGWSSAPTGKALVLHVETEQGQARAIDTSAPSVKFPSGQFGEGTYSFWFEIPGDAAHRSPRTTLRIDFDNATPAAHIQEPPAGAPIEGAVTVAGVATEGAKVSVSGVDLPLDAQYRFRGQASARAGEASLAIRIAHPKHGVHYYLRRLGEP